MLKTEYSLFLGKTSEQFFSGFLTESNFFIVVEIEGASNEAGSLFLSLIRETVKNSEIRNLLSFESIIANALQKANLPLGVSLAAGYTQGEAAFLKTFGEGVIYLRRDKDIALLINGNNYASGHIQKDDVFLLATSRFLSLLPVKDHLKKILISTDVFSVVDGIYEHLGNKDDAGVTALFISPVEHIEGNINRRANQEVVIEEGENEQSMTAKGQLSTSPFNTYLNRTTAGLDGGKKRVMTIGIVIVVFAVLIWSVILGYQRRTAAEMEKKLITTNENVIAKLDKAQDVYSTNPSQSVELITDARKEVKTLEGEVGKEKREDIKKLNTLIDTKEEEITKKESKKAEEFYDLSVDTKNAKAQKIYLNGEDAVLLDKGSKIMYVLSLAKKSLSKRTASEASEATLAAYYQGNVFFFIKNKGVFTVAQGNKIKKVIDTDKDWGSIVDMKVYSGNVYLLDVDKNDVYKYLVAGSSYSEKQSYFKANKDVESANSIAIDSALYVGLPDDILKYNGGLPTDFTTRYPEVDVEIEKIYTDENVDKVFVWDKNSGAVYILGKTGEYDQQIRSSIMKTATDFVARNDGLYFLSGAKLYKVTL